MIRFILFYWQPCDKLSPVTLHTINNWRNTNPVSSANHGVRPSPFETVPSQGCIVTRGFAPSLTTWWSLVRSRCSAGDFFKLYVLSVYVYQCLPTVLRHAGLKLLKLKIACEYETVLAKKKKKILQRMWLRTKRPWSRGLTPQTARKASS